MEKLESKVRTADESEINQIESLTITRNEYAALDLVCGLEPSVHSMVMLARHDNEGNWTLEGTAKTFNALQDDLFDEINYEASPASRLKQLRKLYRRLSPDGEV